MEPLIFPPLSFERLRRRPGSTGHSFSGLPSARIFHFRGKLCLETHNPNRSQRQKKGSKICSFPYIVGILWAASYHCHPKRNFLRNSGHVPMDRRTLLKRLAAVPLLHTLSPYFSALEPMAASATPRSAVSARAIPHGPLPPPGQN